jgi:hypothetical protein
VAQGQHLAAGDVLDVVRERLELAGIAELDPVGIPWSPRMASIVAPIFDSRD